MTENTSPPTVIAPVPVSAGPDPQSMPSDDDEISLLDLLQVVADNLRLLVLGPLAAGLLALGYSFTITPTYTATTKFMPPQQQHSGAAAMLDASVRWHREAPALVYGLTFAGFAVCLAGGWLRRAALRPAVAPPRTS